MGKSSDEFLGAPWRYNGPNPVQSCSGRSLECDVICRETIRFLRGFYRFISVWDDMVIG